MNKIILNFLLILAIISLFGGIIYKLYALDLIAIIFTIILSIIFFVIFNRKEKQYLEKFSKIEIKRKNIKKFKIKENIFSILYFIFFALSLQIIFKSRVDYSIISPWEIIPNYFFVFYTIATLIIIVNILRKKKNSLLLISSHFFLSFSVALFGYSIIYGFDPFIHEATLKLINEKGVVYPKPLYYLGEYSLIIIFHKILFLPIPFLNKYLVAMLSAIFVPFFLNKLLQKLFADKTKIHLTVLSILIIPFSVFIITTPQNLAYLFLLLIIILSISCKNIYDLIKLYILSLATIITQPIAGIPAVLFVILLNLYHLDKNKSKKILFSIVLFLISISLPLSFLILNKNQPIPQNNQENISQNFKLPSLQNPDSDNFLLNFIYLYGANLPYFIIFLASIGIFIFWKYKKECQNFSIHLLTSLALFVSFLLTKLLPFDFLIDYERNNYANRILIISVFFLFPFLLITIYKIVDNTLNQNKFIKNILLLFFTLLITTSLYLSYPRHDNLHNSRGYSTAKIDIDAVKWIEENHQNNYIVLANQQVSAAALHTYGFKTYYKNDIFFYPIPTGGPLYQYYLDMVYKKPSKQTMQKAMDLAGVNESYFILNKYWWAFTKIRDEAKLEAESFKEIENGEIVIFKFSK